MKNCFYNCLLFVFKSFLYFFSVGNGRVFNIYNFNIFQLGLSPSSPEVQKLFSLFNSKSPEFMGPDDWENFKRILPFIPLDVFLKINFTDPQIIQYFGQAPVNANIKLHEVILIDFQNGKIIKILFL